jgi:hypothetical protein
VQETDLVVLEGNRCLVRKPGLVSPFRIIVHRESDRMVIEYAG